MTKRLYVNTIVFSPDLTQVVLLHKLRGPEGVAGRINFPGGGIEQGETVQRAGSREDDEELGLVIPESAWRVADHRSFEHAELTTLVATCETWASARSCTDEPVFVQDVASVLADLEKNPNAYAVGFYTLLTKGLDTMNLPWDAKPSPDGTSRISASRRFSR